MHLSDGPSWMPHLARHFGEVKKSTVVTTVLPEAEFKKVFHPDLPSVRWHDRSALVGFQSAFGFNLGHSGMEGAAGLETRTQPPSPTSKQRD